MRLNASAAQSSSWVSLIPTLQRPSLAAVQPGRRGQAPHTGSGKWNIRTGWGVSETVCWTVTPCGTRQGVLGAVVAEQALGVDPAGARGRGAEGGDGVRPLSPERLPGGPAAVRGIADQGGRVEAVRVLRDHRIHGRFAIRPVPEERRDVRDETAGHGLRDIRLVASKVLGIRLRTGAGVGVDRGDQEIRSLGVIGLLPRHPGLVGCDVLAKDPPQPLDAAHEEGVAGEGLRMREDRSSVGHHRDQLPLLPLQVMPAGARRGLVALVYSSTAMASPSC